MNEHLAKIFKDKIEFTAPCVDRYQKLSLSEQIKVLEELKNYETIGFHVFCKDSQKLEISVFFTKEFFNHQINNFITSAIYDNLLSYICYFCHSNKKENYKIKKEMLDLFYIHQKIDFNVPTASLINSLSVHNDLKTIQYAMSLGAKINLIDGGGESVASASVMIKENIEVFKFAINQKDFNPNDGENVLYLALTHNFSKAIEAIIQSDTQLLENKEFIDVARVRLTHPEKIEQIVLPQYEKFLLEKNIEEKKHNKKIKL
jgi:hypothetical protein